MDVGKIISNSFRYPFRNIKKLPILFIIFILSAIIPIGIIFDNRYVTIIGVFAFFLFILIAPGYMFSMIDFGLNESSMFPSISFTRNVYNSLRLWVLRIVYMIVPALVFFIALSTLGVSSIDLLKNLKVIEFLLTLGLTFIIILVIYLLFEFLLFFAKARLAYLNSLSEALKMHKVVLDIKHIGVKNIIKWLILMVICMVVVSAISSLVMSIPYVGFLIYFCVIIPTLESIANYSLGLLYSNIAVREGNLDKLDMEVQQLKYLN